MNKKLEFSVENVSLIEERNSSQFVTLEIDVFASGKNLHDMYVSEETLQKNAKTILSKPITWVYDQHTRDAGTHDPKQTPVGFIPPETEIKFRVLPDGRTMMTVLGKVWKMYSGEFLNVFKRDGGKKKISVEMELFSTQDRQDGLTELIDYCFSAITTLGEMFSPAIPSAEARMAQFAKDYQDAYDKEFNTLKIPEVIKESVRFALENYKSTAGSVALSTARHILRNETLSENKIKELIRFFSKDDADEAAFALYGGKECKDWILSTFVEKKGTGAKENGEKIMPYSKISEINPALKGIEPPISLSQANEIARQADAIGSDEKKNGWAIAISGFKKSHKVEDDKWVKKDSSKAEMAKEENNVMEKENEVNMAETEPKVEVEVEVEKEKEDEKEEEKEKEEEPKKEKMAESGSAPAAAPAPEFSLDSYLDVAAMLEILQDETDANEEIVGYAVEELKKPDGRDFAKVVCGMGCKMSKMFAKMKDLKTMMAEKESVMAQYESENKALKEFKANIEKQQFEFAVASTLKDVESYVPKGKMEELRAKSVEFSLETIDGFNNLVKSVAFEYVAKKEDDGVKKYGLPYSEKKSAGKASLWG